MALQMSRMDPKFGVWSALTALGLELSTSHPSSRLGLHCRALHISHGVVQICRFGVSRLRLGQLQLLKSLELSPSHPNRELYCSVNRRFGA